MYRQRQYVMTDSGSRSVCQDTKGLENLLRSNVPPRPYRKHSVKKILPYFIHASHDHDAEAPLYRYTLMISITLGKAQVWNNLAIIRIACFS